MKFCSNHWAAMRQAVDDRGLTHLIASGDKFGRLREGVTRDTFNPLMHLHWSISGNIMDILGRAGINPLYLLSSTDPPKGRSDCPLCEINLLHEQGCTDPRCTLDKKAGYDWMIARAADDALEKARELGLVGPPS